MNVAYVCGFGDIEVSDGGGIGIVATNLARQMMEYTSVLIAVPGKSNTQTTSDGLIRLEVASLYQGGHYAPVLNPANNRFVSEHLASFAPDVVHLHDFSPLTMFVAKWAHKQQIPVIVTIHVLPSRVFDFALSEVVPAKFVPPNLSKLDVVQRLYRSFFADCDSVIALNTAAQADIRLYAEEKKIVLIPNGVKQEALLQFPPPSLSSQPIQLTFLGHLCERKNQSFLIDVMQQLDDRFVLRLVGNELNQGFQKKLQRRATKKAPGRILFEKAIPHKEIASVLGDTHFFVSASKHEVQSLVILEALASGTPIIALANETTTELVDDSVGKLLDSDTTPKAFAAAVMRLANISEPSYQELSDAARERMQAYTWAEVAKKTYRHYAALLDRIEPPYHPIHRAWGYLILATVILTPLHFLWRLWNRAPAKHNDGETQN